MQRHYCTGFTVFTVTLTALLGILFSTSLPAQTDGGPCDPGTLSYTVDLSGQPSGIYESPLDSRTGLCCGARFPDRCVQFFIRLDRNARGLKFDIVEGAVPPGSLFYQIDCGPVVQVGQPICLEGGKDYTLTFCKPGNNPNAYRIESIPGALIPDTVETQVNCPVEIQVSGLQPSTLVWRDVNSSAGAYSRYLNCTRGCDRVIATPDEEAERFIRYEVCGTVTADQCPLTFEVCDTVVLEVLPTPRTTERVDICEGFSYEWRGRSFTRAGFYTDTLISALGCDSLVSLDLKVNPSRRGSQTATICPGEVYELGGQGFTQAGTYEVTLTDSINCDSVITLDLQLLPGPTPAIAGPKVLCNGESATLQVTEAFNSYQWSNGGAGRSITVSLPGTYTVTVTSGNGCTTTVSYTLEAAPTLDASISGGGTITCTDEVLTLRSAVYTDPALEGVELEWTNAQGRSLGNSASLQVRQSGRYYLEVKDRTGSCRVQDSVQVDDNGDVPQFSIAKSGDLDCSLSEVTLSVDADTSSQNVGIRWTGPSIISGNPNLVVSQPGWYTMEVTNTENGCSTIDSLRVRQNVEAPAIRLTDEVQLRCDPAEVTLEATVAEGDFSYRWRTSQGDILGDVNRLSIRAAAGGWYYLDVTDAGNGCTATDSTLVIAPEAIVDAKVEVKASCSNEPGGLIEVDDLQGGKTPFTYTLNGAQETTDGVYTNLMPGTYNLAVVDGYGCRWDTTIRVEAVEIAETTELVEICDGLNYEWNGRNYTEAGIYTDTLTASTGCDSIATLDLRVNTSNVRVTQRVSICPGDTYEAGGQTFREPGVYNIVLAGSIACDSIITLELSHYTVQAPEI